MPAYRTRTVLEVVRGIKAFLSLETGVVRGDLPDSASMLEEARKREQDLKLSLERARTREQRLTQRLVTARNRLEEQVRDPQKPPAARKPGWHRRAVGGMWEEVGELQLAFLRERGLEPQHYLLDVGCGPLRGGVRFVPYLEPGHYYGVDRNQELLDAGRRELEAANLQDRGANLARIDDFGFERLDREFDYAIAQSLFTHLPLNSIARCLVNVARVLRPGGVFFATFFENRGGKRYLDQIEQGDGLLSYYDKNPYHYTPDAFEWACEETGLIAEYLGDWGHPRNQMMMAFRKG